MGALAGNPIASYYLDRLGRASIEGRRNPLYYYDSMHRIAFMGHYEGTCGGCDTIHGYPLLLEAIQSARDRGFHIVMEGLLLSEDVKQCLTIPEFTEEARVIFLATEIDQCVSDIKKRRLAAGNDKPLNEDNTRNRVKRIASARRRLEESGVYCRSLSRNQAPSTILRWLGVV